MTGPRRRTAASAALVLLALLGAGAANAAPARASGWIAVSPDGNNLYATGGKTLSFRRDPASGELTPIDLLGPPGGTIAISPDGAWAFVGSGNDNGAIQILSRDPATGLLTHQGTFLEDAASGIAPGQITDLEMSRDGRFLYVSQEWENALVVLAVDPASGALAPVETLYGGPDGELGGDSPVYELALSPDGSSLYAAAGSVLTFAVDAATGRLRQLAAPALDSRHAYVPQAWHVAVAPDGRRVYAGVFNPTAYDRDPATGLLAVRDTTNLGSSYCTACEADGPFAISPDGASMLVVDSRSDSLFQIAPTADGAEVTHEYHDFAGASDGDGLAWSPDGRFAYDAGGERLTPELTSNNPGPLSIATLRREADGSLTSVSVIRPTPPAPDWTLTEGVSVNGGAIYTNDPHVRLRVTLPSWYPSSFRISNSPEFTGVRPTRVTGVADSYDWLLDDSSGPVRSVKHVWVRFTGDGTWPDSVVADDIILDQTPPQVVSAQLKRVGSHVVLNVRATDNRSGVKRVQVTPSRGKPGQARPFASRIVVAGAPRTLYVRVRDGAGNFSTWRRARR